MKLLGTNISRDSLGAKESKGSHRLHYFARARHTVSFELSLDSIGLKLFWENKLNELVQFGQDLKDAKIHILALRTDLKRIEPQ